MTQRTVFIFLMLAFLVALIFASTLLCWDGVPVLQCRSTGVLVDEGIRYTRADPLPGYLFRFSHWAGEAYFDQDLGTSARAACYSTVDGLGCDVRYQLDS